MSSDPALLSASPWWTWPSRIAGALLLMLALLGPLAWLYRRSEQAVQQKRVIQEPALVSAPLRPRMLHLPAGDFLMGSTKVDDEKPPHVVKISRPFALSETEVTQAQYQALMGENPSYFKDKPNAADRPVEQISWLDAVRYCNKLSDREGLKTCYQIQEDDVRWPEPRCAGYRLPTEAEWEYAARAEQSYEYAGSNNLDAVAWHNGNAQGETHPVATRRANSWFLFDMSGNVWEWVWDRYHNSYASAEKVDPTGPKTGGNCALRGGSFAGEAERARVALRGRGAPSDRDWGIGFRLARSLP
jgi:formylglycine-generating enzyme required for sulfatase activity